MNVIELRDKHPEQFAREYAKWREHAADYDWWDSIEEYFIEDCTPLGISVTEIFFSLAYCQGDHAGFTGTVLLHRVMEYFNQHEQYPALYEAIKEDGSYVRLTPGRYGMNYSVVESLYAVPPVGIFADLDEETWNELVDDQWRDADLEKATRDWMEALAADLYKDLVQGYEYLTSEESFIEHCQNNEVEFDAEGDGE